MNLEGELRRSRHAFFVCFSSFCLGSTFWIFKLWAATTLQEGEIPGFPMLVLSVLILGGALLTCLIGFTMLLRMEAFSRSNITSPAPLCGSIFLLPSTMIVVLLAKVFIGFP